jgi:GNAT superfamily N-acetyltransferase
MNDGRVRIGEDSKVVELEGLAHKEAERVNGQGPRVGRRVTIRVATPRDAEGLRAMFSRASSESVYLRFHTPFSDVPERMLAMMLDADHHHREVLLAVAGGEIVGHAMFARLGSTAEAEMAIIVEDGWQSKGVGKLLLSELARRARLGGIETFIGEVLGENRRMLGLAAMFSGTAYTMEEGVWHVLMPLGALQPTTYTARTRPRAA